VIAPQVTAGGQTARGGGRDRLRQLKDAAEDRGGYASAIGYHTTLTSEVIRRPPALEASRAQLDKTVSLELDAYWALVGRPGYGGASSIDWASGSSRCRPRTAGTPDPIAQVAVGTAGHSPSRRSWMRP